MSDYDELNYGINYMGRLKKKPGRKPGTGTMTGRIAARASETTLQQLAWIKTCSQKCKDMSDAEIIAYLVDEHVALQEVYFYHLPRFKFKP